MSKLQSVKVFVCQRLTAAVEEIIGHLESTMTEYEEEMECHHRKLLESVSKREEEMQTADVPLHLLMKEEQQDLRPGLDQEDPVRPHVKEEQEDSWTSQEVKSQLYAIPPLQEDTSELPFTRVPVKSEDDQEKPQSSPPHRRQTDEHGEAEPPASSSAEHMETDADGADGGGSEPDRVSVPAFKCVSEPAKKTSRCSGAVSKDRDDDRKEIRKPQTDLSVVKNIVPVSDVGHDTGNKLFSCSKCGKRFGQKHHLQTHMRCHTGEKPFSCPLCGKTFSQKGNLTQHMTIHTRGKPISCSVCGEGFTQKGNLTQHMTVHRRENFVGERSTKGL